MKYLQYEYSKREFAEQDFEDEECLKVEINNEMLLDRIAHLVAMRIAKSTVYQLKMLKDDLLSGDDTTLKNTWEEICVQVQDEYSYYWCAYEDTIKSIIVSGLEKEPVEFRDLLSHMSEINETRYNTGYNEEYAIKPIYVEVLNIAMEYRNKSLDKYFLR